MKELLFAVFAVLVLNVSALAEEPGSQLLQDEHFNLKIYPGGLVKCWPGLASNGHNFPSPTTLNFELAPYDSWGHVYFNSTDFRFSSAALGNFCKDYERITQMATGQSVTAPSERKVYESFHHATANAKQICLRSFREEMSVTIEGVRFDGVEVFDVGAADESHCKGQP